MQSLQSIGTAVQDVARTQRQQAEHYASDQHRSCHRTFKTCNYEAFKERNPNRIEGTCTWVLQHPRYRAWRESSHSDLLWISADPGCGKSVLAKAFVDDNAFSISPQTTVCYFFFKDNEDQDGITTALCSLLHQLFSQQPQLLSYAMKDWEMDGDKLRLETDKLWRIFENATMSVKEGVVVCVLDALDECKELDRGWLLERLSSFYSAGSQQSRQHSVLKFVVTSRPYEDLERKFNKIPEIRLRGEDENKTLRQEIDVVVRQRIQELAGEVGIADSTHRQLEKKLLEMEHRTYLWLYLAIEAIRATFTDSLCPDQESIETLPTSVQDAYEKILAKVQGKRINLAQKILTIVFGTRRPLSIGELAHGLSIMTGERVRSDLETWIRRWCGLFIFFSDSKVYLIHQTAKEFLLSYQGPMTQGWKGSFDVTHVQYQVGKICIQVLCTWDLDQSGSESTDDADTQIDLKDDKRTFWKYCAEYWTNHLYDAYDDIIRAVPDEVDDLHNVEGERFGAWFPLTWKAKSLDKFVPKMTTARLCSFTGHVLGLEKTLCINKKCLEDCDDEGRNALFWSSYFGHKESVQILLDKGADVNARGWRHGNALQAASRGGYKQIVQILLNKGADVNAQRGGDGNALVAASIGGHEQIVQMLLDRGANVDTEDKYINALLAASIQGNAQIIPILLDRGADINAQGEYSTALLAASIMGNEQTVLILLDRGADVNAQGKHGTALQAASRIGCQQIIQILLNKGADVNAQEGPDGTALQAASSRGYKQIVQMLLNKGANVNAQGGPYGNALQAAR